MGREIRRVPLDFDWPINQIWKGFVSPYSGVKCTPCDGRGYSPESRRLMEIWYGFHKEPEYISMGGGRRYNTNAWCHNLEQEDVDVLLEHDRLWDFTRVPINDEQREIVRKEIAAGRNSWLPHDNGYHPTAAEVNEWSKSGFGHDSLNQSYVVEARCKKLGVPSTCRACEGGGEIWQSPEIEKLAEDWEPFDPPQGEGWQLWETVSEGSPITPVFATSSGLVDYMVNGDAWEHKWTRKQAEAMVAEGFTLSGLAVDGRFMRAEEAVQYSHELNMRKGRHEE